MFEFVERYREVDIMRFLIADGVPQYYFIHDGKRSQDFNSLGEARFVVNELLGDEEEDG